MISPEQITQIAALPDKFERDAKGETVVVVTLARGVVVRIDEDGTRFGITPGGDSWSFTRVTCNLEWLFG